MKIESNIANIEGNFELGEFIQSDLDAEVIKKAEFHV